MTSPPLRVPAAGKASRRRIQQIMGQVVEEFLNAPGPAILQEVVDPLEPALPAKVTADQALKFAESVVRGEPKRAKIALTALSDKVRELV
jgi:pyruvate dehydrogenase (quinone)